MVAHRIKEYVDGYMKVEYCTICGKEGRELIDDPDCVVDKKDIKQIDFFTKDIDKRSEQT